MEMVLTSADFQINGISYPGFPLILDNQQEIVPEVFDYLVRKCIERGRVSSLHSWKAYGQSLYDYFSFLEANNRWDWRAVNTQRSGSVLASYRDWSIGIVGLKPATVNYRLRVIVDFYRHAYQQNWITAFPFEMEEVIVRHAKTFLIHAKDQKGKISSPDVMLKEPATAVKVLNREQIKQFLGSLNNPTQKLMARLALQTGLRKEELVTFPLRYVLNPETLSGNTLLISVALEPSEMKTKGDKPRNIHVPVGLMSDLWDYSIHERNHRALRGNSLQRELFLNRYGKPYANAGGALNKLWDGHKLPFKVSPHILRHTYATHTLYELRKRPGLGVDPLMYVRDRLGHTSILTTQKYLHFIDDVERELITDYQSEIDRLSVEE